MNSTTLKLIALILMIIDHVGHFISGTPIWLRWIGRLSAPIFMFTMVWGLYYTRDRKKYLLKMYYFNIIMAVGDIVLALIFPAREEILYSNIFGALFLIGIIGVIIEKYRNGEKEEGKKLLGRFVLIQIGGIIISIMTLMIFPKPYHVYLIPSALLPNILYCEGGPIWFIIGVLLYILKDNKKKLILFYPIMSFVTFILGSGFNFTYENLFLVNFQWMMIFSLPFMLIYNGEKGKGLKWLFYIFYPVHIFILYIIGNYI